MLENLNLKLEDVRKQKEQLIANLNALSGAEQILIQLIEEVKAEKVAE